MKKKLLLSAAALWLHVVLFSQDYQVERGNRAFIKKGDSLCIIIGTDTTFVKTTNILVIDGHAQIILRDDLSASSIYIGDTLWFDDGTYMFTVPAVADTARIALQAGYSGHCVNAWLDNVYGCSPVRFYTVTHTGTNNLLEAYNDLAVLLMSLSDAGDLTLNGTVRVGAEAGISAAGMIQWNGSLFKGYDGSSWHNLGIPNGSAYGDLLIWDNLFNQWRTASNINFRDMERRLSIGAAPYANTLLSLRTVNTGGSSSFLQGEDASGILRIRINDEGNIITSGYGEFSRLTTTGTGHAGTINLLDLKNDLTASVFSVNDTGAVTAGGDISTTGVFKNNGFSGLTGAITVLCDVRDNAGQLQKRELVITVKGGIITRTIESIWLDTDDIP